MPMPARVSIIIPTLNEEKIISNTLEALKKLNGDFEIIIADGGSRDRTEEFATRMMGGFPDFSFIKSKRGRGIQMNTGAQIASGEALLFLHADTALPENAVASIQKALQNAQNIGGNFLLSFDGKDIASRVFTRIYNWRRWFGIYYGDSAIWVRRDVFERLGGYADAAVMEDYDFCRKLERAGHTVCLQGPAITSSRRWAGGRTLLVLMIWILIQWMFLLGVRPERMAWLYYPGTFKFRVKRSKID